MWTPDYFSDAAQDSTFVKCKTTYKCQSYLNIGLTTDNN